MPQPEGRASLPGESDGTRERTLSFSAVCMPLHGEMCGEFLNMLSTFNRNALDSTLGRRFGPFGVHQLTLPRENCKLCVKKPSSRLNFLR